MRVGNIRITDFGFNADVRALKQNLLRLNESSEFSSPFLGLKAVAPWTMHSTSSLQKAYDVWDSLDVLESRKF